MLQKFIEQNYQRKKGAIVPLKLIIKEYKEYCAKNNVKPVCISRGNGSIVNQLKKLGFNKTWIRVGKQVTCIEGLYSPKTMDYLRIVADNHLKNKIKG
jgi:hypothetical protein